MTTREFDQNEAKFDLEKVLDETWPPGDWRNITVLLAVSGGADSVAMLRAMGALKCEGSGRLVVAHYNHNTRGAASAADEQFVVELSHKLGLTCEVGRAEAAASSPRDEQTWRNERYRFLEATAQRVGARFVVTAHTADDQAETILHRIIRGTGISGLAGIPRVRALGHASLIRPLLAVHREQLLDYLKELGQDFRNDASNEDRQFMRNRIRHELLPRLQHDYNPQVVNALLRLGRVAGDAQDTLDTNVLEKLWQESVTLPAGGGVLLVCERLRQETPFLIHETLIRAYREQQWSLQAMGQAQWERLSDMILAEANDAPPVMLPGAIRAAREGAFLSLRQTDA